MEQPGRTKRAIAALRRLDSGERLVALARRVVAAFRATTATATRSRSQVTSRRSCSAAG